MWYTYIIQSQQNKKYYIGYTSNLEIRLSWHNEGKSGWTRKYIPWEIVYYENFKEKREAIKREKQSNNYNQTNLAFFHIYTSFLVQIFHRLSNLLMSYS